MNLGTPQEMIDEEREYYESIGRKPPSSGCLAVFVILIIVLIGFIIW